MCVRESFFPFPENGNLNLGEYDVISFHFETKENCYVNAYRVNVPEALKDEDFCKEALAYAKESYKFLAFDTLAELAEVYMDKAALVLVAYIEKCPELKNKKGLLHLSVKEDTITDNLNYNKIFDAALQNVVKERKEESVGKTIDIKEEQNEMPKIENKLNDSVECKASCENCDNEIDAEVDDEYDMELD